ncbi:MAG: 1-acyl-sn-glycerol-3-phosphate acyltransferase [Eggerthellaceae bacterium]|nr:1-acyl-sn-glycerol-3-phosphate acyltransferase [Eggerthellaceae bacterium]
MGLFLSQQEMCDRPISKRSKSYAEGGAKTVTHWFGNIAFCIAFVITKILWRYKVTGRERLRAFDGKSGVILCCNHTSYLDVAFLYISVRMKQWVRLLGRETLFQNAGGLSGQILSRVGAIPIARDQADIKGIKRAVKILKDGEVLGIYPEGTRRGKSGRAPRIMPGVTLIAQMSKAPVLPIAIVNAGKIKPKGKMPRFPRVYIRFGEPFSLDDFDYIDKAVRKEAFAWYTMREVYALAQNCAPTDVDMKALFPHDTDFSELFEKKAR